MATLQRYFPGGVTPDQYDPPIDGYDFMPAMGDLVDFGTVVSRTTSSTQASLTLGNGIQFQYLGTGLTFDGVGNVTGGTITQVRVTTSSGQLIEKITGFSISAASFQNLMNDGAWDLQTYILRGADKLNGGAGPDDLFASAGNDVLRGNGGDDFLVGGAGVDKYYGGAGWDQLSFHEGGLSGSQHSGVTINAVTRKAIDPYGNTETFSSIESFRGTKFVDTFKGSGADEQFMGLRGADKIDGGAGFDQVRYHRDVNHGGNKGVTVDLEKGYAIDGFKTRDTLTGIESVRGTDFKDKLYGSAGSNFLRGDGGADVLYGKAGNDDLQGGGGKDRFYFDTALSRTKNVDDIVDFDTVNDLIFLDNAIFSKIVGTGKMSNAQFYASNAGVAHDANDRIIYDENSGNLYYDSNGKAAGGAVLFAKLSTGLDLTASDFFIY